MKRVVLKDKSWGDNEKSKLEAFINDQGDLVLEGYDCGESVKKHYGDFDLEYWYTVEAKKVHDVLLNLVQDRFDNSSDYLEWLKEKV